MIDSDALELKPTGHQMQRLIRWNRTGIISWCCVLIMILKVSRASTSELVVSSEEDGISVTTGRKLTARESGNSCEFNVEYSIHSVNRNEFEATMAVKSNRDEKSPLQIVYRLVDAVQKDLEYVTDAILVTRGNGTYGIPIRMKTFESSSPGETKKIKSAIRFTNNPSQSTSLGIQDLNVNGIQCNPVLAKDVITYGTCSNALSFFQSFNGRPPPTNGGMDECSMSFCCGVVPIPVEPKIETALAPAPEGQQIAPSPVPEQTNITETPLIVEDLNIANQTDTIVSQGESAVDETSSGGSSAVLIGAVVGVAAVLIIVVIISILCIRSRRKRSAVSPETNTKPSNTPRRQPSSVRPTTVSNIVALSGSQIGKGSTVTTLSIAGQGDLPTPIDTLPDDLPEDVILHEQLGAGAFGTVFRGEWGGHTVAVKVLQTAYSSNSRELDSFRQEIAVLSGLRHPNIIAFLAACTISPDICIIEELAEGGSLHTKLHGPSGSENRCRPLAIEDAIQVAIDVAQAMVYLHPSIVHRDLKSQNVLLDSDGRAKVCDFGIAKFKDRTFVSTMNGQAGTPAYMAPELFDGVNATEKVDVYSYAILLWECITGKVPWGHVPSHMQIIYYVGVLNQRPRFPDSVSEPFKKLIEDCWVVDPKERPSFQQILTRLLEMKQTYTSQKGLPTQVPIEPENESVTTEASDDEQFASDQVANKGSNGISLTACALNAHSQTKSYPLKLDSSNGID